jgi:DNA-binding HxlR family transcriptional regulator
MSYSKDEVLNAILQPYILDILRSLKERPKRYGELKNEVKNDRTLSLKLSKLQDYGFIEFVHIKVDTKYVNCYTITPTGKKIIDVLKRL